MNKIPVLGVPIVNGVHWLQRLIKSIDYPVENLIIINNNGRGQITEELNNIQEQDFPLIDNIHILHLPGNIGVAGAWNLIIKSFIMAPYWIISNHDIEYGPGLLKFLHDGITSDKTVDMAHVHPGEFFRVFCINRKRSS